MTARSDDYLGGTGVGELHKIRAKRTGRGRSAASATTTAREAAQVYCAASGEHKLLAGLHVAQFTRFWGNVNHRLVSDLKRPRKTSR